MANTPSSPPIRRAVRSSTPLFRHSSIAFIGHWKGQLCILIVVLVVGLIYFVVKEPIERWQARRREERSRRVREGLLRSVEREKSKDRERERDRDRDRAGSVSQPVGASASSESIQSGAVSTSNSSVSANAHEGKKARRRKSSVLRVNPSAAQSSALRVPSSTSMSLSASSNNSGTSTPALHPLIEQSEPASSTLSHKDDKDLEMETITKRRDKGKRRAIPMDAADDLQRDRKDGLPSIHIRQPTGTTLTLPTTSLSADTPAENIPLPPSPSPSGILALSSQNEQEYENDAERSGAESGHHTASSVTGSEGGSSAPSVSGTDHSVADSETSRAKSRGRAEGFSIFPDEGWLPPSALQPVSAASGKKKKKGKNGNAASNGNGSGGGRASPGPSSALLAAVSSANALPKLGESSRSEDSSHSHPRASSSGTRSALPPLPIPSSAPIASSAPLTLNEHILGSASTSDLSSPVTPRRHSRKTSMGYRMGTVDEQVRERDEIIDSLRAEVGRAKAEEAKAKEEVRVLAAAAVSRAGDAKAREKDRRKGEQDKDKKRATPDSAEYFQEQLQHALSSVTDQQARIQLLEQFISSSGLAVPERASSAGRPQLTPADLVSDKGSRARSNSRYNGPPQPRMNRIASMPNPNGGLESNGHHNTPLSARPILNSSNHLHPLHSPSTASAHTHQHMSPMIYPSPFMMASPNPSMLSHHLYPSPGLSPIMQQQHPQQAQQMAAMQMHQMQMAQLQMMQQGHAQQVGYASPTVNGNGLQGFGNTHRHQPSSPSPYRRPSTATSVSGVSIGRRSDSAAGSSDKDHHPPHYQHPPREREAWQRDRERERERDDNLGVADHPLAGPLTPGKYSHFGSPSPSRIAFPNTGSLPSNGTGTANDAQAGVFGMMQIAQLQNQNGMSMSMPMPIPIPAPLSGDMMEAHMNGAGLGEMSYSMHSLGSYPSFPSMEDTIDVGALGYADTGIGRPPGETRGMEGKRRQSVESSVLKKKVEPLRRPDEGGFEEEDGDGGEAQGNEEEEYTAKYELEPGKQDEDRERKNGDTNGNGNVATSESTVSSPELEDRGVPVTPASALGDLGEQGMGIGNGTESLHGKGTDDLAGHARKDDTGLVPPPNDLDAHRHSPIPYPSPNGFLHPQIQDSSTLNGHSTNAQYYPYSPNMVPLSVSPIPHGHSFPLNQSNGVSTSGHITNGKREVHELAPPISTPLKLADFEPTFASLAHTPEQVMEIKRGEEEAVRRAIEREQLQLLQQDMQSQQQIARDSEP